MNIEQNKRLDAALARLPHNIEPQRDLWSGIEARISQHGPQRLSLNWNYGFAVAAVLVLGFAVTWISLHRHALAPDNNFAAVVAPVNPTLAEPTDLHAQFSAQLASDANMPQTARKALVDNLLLIHDALMRTQTAVKTYPNDINLQALLLDLYQQEAQLMAEAQQAQIETTVRTTI